MSPTPITTLTANAIQQNLQTDGLDVLGLTGLSFSPRWSDTTPSYNPEKLTLMIYGLRAPFRGILEFSFSRAVSELANDLTDSINETKITVADGSNFPSPSGGSVLLTLSDVYNTKFEIVECTSRNGNQLTIARGANGTASQCFNYGDKVALRLTNGPRTHSFYGADGNPLTGACAIFRLHPQAVLRLETLTSVQYGGTAGNKPMLPVPRTMVVRGKEGFRSACWYEADDILDMEGEISFHDGRGFIIDPIYVAALFADLQKQLPALVVRNYAGPFNGNGTVNSISNLASGTLVHCVDLHGAIYQPAFIGATLVTTDNSGVVNGSVPSNGLVTLNAGEGISAASTDNGRLRWGYATNGILSRNGFVPPALPFNRQFYRLAVVDTVWALLGNRTNLVEQGIEPDDSNPSYADILPTIRDQVVIDYLVDGPDVLAQAATVLTKSPQKWVLAVSPVLDENMSIPTQVGNAHWPVFPQSNASAGFSAGSSSPASGIKAAWTVDNDVVVTLAANSIPDGAHVRIYPQSFVEIEAISEEPSFIRADGGAAIGQLAMSTQFLLPDPFNLGGGQRPNPANLTIDIVVTTRQSQRKIWAAVLVHVDDGPTQPPVDQFGGGNGNPIGLLKKELPMALSIAPEPLFGIPTTETASVDPDSSIISLIRAFASETSPRQGPRLPTMARFETIIVSGTTGGTPTNTLLWDAVLSGGRWEAETRSALHAMGNPGNPAGPDLHASGIHVTGALAYDLARHAIRRAQPIIPLGSESPGWLIGMAGDNFDVPVDNNASNTGIGVLLETVAAYCETPELALPGLNPPAPGSKVQDAIDYISSILNITLPSFIINNEQRLQRELRREFIVSANGLRDALWSLLRAISQARELIYIESPQFSFTARPQGLHKKHEIDLVAKIAASLEMHPNLKVIICTPRESDFAPKYKTWSRQHFAARKEAVSKLLTIAPDRVSVFHPAGFPGRTAFIRTTTVIVDDVWCLVGATHWRRRGMTFDGSAAVASFDRQIENCYSKKVSAFRRALMAAKLGIQMPSAGAVASADWMRLGQPGSAFELVAGWLSQGGMGKIKPLWSGPDQSIQTIIPKDDDIADPDGSDGLSFDVETFLDLIIELGE